MTRQRARRLAWLVVLLPGVGWAQSPAPFEEVNASLSRFADETLAAARAAKEEMSARETVPAARAADTPGPGAARMSRWRPLLEPILREEGVPAELAAVVLVESGGRPAALSPKGALGLWQLMPQTARRYGLEVSEARDERLDPRKATRAAARYLRDLQAQFGDWALALAAYNFGERGVGRALARSGGGAFEQIRAGLPAETRAYVPTVLAAMRREGSAQPLPGAGAKRGRAIYASAQPGE